MTEDQIRSLIMYNNSNVYDEKEKVTIRFADIVTRGAVAVNNELLENLHEFYTEEEIVELALVICIANFTNRFNDALLVKPDLG